MPQLESRDSNNSVGKKIVQKTGGSMTGTGSFQTQNIAAIIVYSHFLQCKNFK